MTGVVEAVAKLIARDAVGLDELSRWLEPEDTALLEQQITVSSWYDVRIYDRMNALLLEIEGGGDPEYFRQQGRKTARRLLDSGLYAQMEYLNRVEASKETDPVARFEAFGRDLRLLNSLSGSILNFSRWRSTLDPDRERRYRIEVSDAAEMPESLCWRSDGFVNGMAEVHGRGDLWRWERPRCDLVLFLMQRDI